jgi:hypothetical protein
MLSEPRLNDSFWIPIHRREKHIPLQAVNDQLTVFGRLSMRSDQYDYQALKTRG